MSDKNNKLGFAGKKVKLGDIAELINGDRGKNYPSQADITDDGDIPFVNAGHLNGRSISFNEMNYISHAKYENLNSGKFQPKDILYCLRGSLGKKALVTDSYGAIASSLVIIRPNTDLILSEYLLAALDSPSVKEQLRKANNGSSQPNLSAASVREYKINLPSIETQRKIVNLITKSQRLVDIRFRQMNELDTLIKARFVEMFGDPVTNPYDLPIISLGEACSLITKGASPSWQGFSYTEDASQTLFVTSENVREGYLDLSAPKYIEDGFNEKQKRSVLQKGDILINIVGASIGRAAQFNLECKANINQAAALVRLSDGRISDKYLLIYLNSEKAQQMYNSMKSDTGRANLSLQDIANLSIMIPSIEAQIEFATFVTQVDKSKVAIQKSLDELQTLFNSMMQEYFG